MTVYDFSAHLLNGDEVSLAQWRGRVLLIVNTASECGFTPQYAGLQTLYERYEPRGLTVLGFPCDQFGGQEPGDAEEIGAFCQRNYGVTFPMFGKIEVNGDNADPLFRYLKAEKSGLLGTQAIKWNFTKFLVNRAGLPVSRHAPREKPQDLAGAIEKLL